jgi:hypothetical protein
MNYLGDSLPSTDLLMMSITASFDARLVFGWTSWTESYWAMSAWSELFPASDGLGIESGSIEGLFS